MKLFYSKPLTYPFTSPGFSESAQRLPPPQEPQNFPMTRHSTLLLQKLQSCLTEVPVVRSSSESSNQVWSSSHVAPSCSHYPDGPKSDTSWDNKATLRSRAGPAPRTHSTYSVKTGPFNPAHRWHETQYDSDFIIRSGQSKRSSKRGCCPIPLPRSSGEDDAWAGHRRRLSPRPTQNITWGLKCICLVALFFTPIFSSHFDFILWTYCMSRWRTRAAPGVAKGARKQAKVCDLGSEKTHLAENQTWFGATGFLYLNKSYHLGSLSSGPWWGGRGGSSVPRNHTPELLSVHIPLGWVSWALIIWKGL